MEKRIFFLDYMRVIACFMVIIVHSCEFYFIDGSEIGIRSLSDGFWVSVIDSALRCSVPLFVMISAYLLVPIKGSVTNFFKKRFVRVIVPFIVWSLLYAVLPILWDGMDKADVISSLCRLVYNFNDASGHMWFIYMLIGIYLFMPVISPWLEKAGKRAEEVYLALWFVSSFFPYIRSFVGYIYGECYWNEYNLLWYFSGFLGYVVLAHYIKNYLTWGSKTQITVGILLYFAGYLVTAVIWYNRILTATTLQELELSWRFCTPNVIFESIGSFLIIQSIFSKKDRENALVREVSKLSYGIYLMHIFILGIAFSIVSTMRLSTPITILITGVSTFVCCIFISRIISFIPNSEYIIG